MNKLLSILLGAALASAPASAAAADDTKHAKGMSMGMDMKMMDTNNDGMVSKDEFTKHHEMMWGKMKKNKSGMVDIKDMNMMHDSMMKGGDPMKGDGPMKGDSMKGHSMNK